MKLTKKWVAERLLLRSKDAHKGTFGKVLAIAGAEEYPGAAYLACAAAYRAGAGLVTLATEPEVKVIISRKLPEVTFLKQEEIIKNINRYDVLLIGPGLGQKPQITELLEQLLEEKLPKTVIDADGLNVLSQINNWWNKLGNQIIMTPHPGEMARLTGLSIEEIQKNRVHTAQEFAKKWDKIIVLKGANTVIASFDQTSISPFANPLLATAGTGDILTGIIAGLLAQGMEPFEASASGVYIHGLAGEMLREKLGNTGALASDLLSLIPQVIKKLV